MPPKKRKPSQIRDAINRIGSALETWNQISKDVASKTPAGSTPDGEPENLNRDHFALFSKLAQQMRELSGDHDEASSK